MVKVRHSFKKRVVSTICLVATQLFCSPTNRCAFTATARAVPCQPGRESARCFGILGSPCLKLGPGNGKTIEIAIVSLPGFPGDFSFPGLRVGKKDGKSVGCRKDQVTGILVFDILEVVLVCATRPLE